jgi:hypothetical protein
MKIMKNFNLVKSFLAINVLLLSITAAFSQTITLTGNCTLQGISSSKEINVLINSYEKKDSFFISEFNNDFSVDIPQGIYSIYIYKDHYEPVIFRELHLDNDYHLQDIELKFNEDYLFFDDDSISGIYNSGIINILSDIFVPEGKNLTITGDASLHFPVEKQLMVFGSLSLIGSKTNPVLVETNIYPEEFRFIFGNVVADSIYADYCVFRNFHNLFLIQNKKTTITNSTFIETRVIINSYHDSARVLINKCNVFGDGYATVACKTNVKSHMTIKNTYFTGINPFYVFDESSMDFDSCIVDNCGLSLVKHQGFLRANFSVFKNCFDPVGCATTSTAYFDHCTFSNNRSAIRFREYETFPANIPDTSLYLSNSIITDCTYSLWNWSNDKYLKGFLSYNLFNNTILYEMPFDNTGEFGNTSYYNSNGNQCDVYFNIFMSPFLMNNLFPYWGSPVINAGDPGYPFDPDNTVTDIGAFFYDHFLGNNSNTLYSNGVNIYPNPASDIIHFDISANEDISGTAVLTIYNMDGVPVTELYEPLSATNKASISLSLKNRGINAGLYVYTLVIPGQDATSGKITVVN